MSAEAEARRRMMRMSKKFLTLLLVLALTLPSLAALKGLEPAKEESVVKVGENIDIPEGTEIDSAVAIGGNISIGGKVKQDVVAIGGDVILQKSAVVVGDVVSVGGTIQKDPAAIIKGSTTEVKFPVGVLSKGLGWGIAILSILSFLAFLVLALIVVAFFGKQLGASSYYVEKLPWHALLWGILIPPASVLIIIFLVLSILGIVFIPVYLLLLMAAGFLGYIAVSQLIGKKVMKALRVYNKPMVVEVLVGLLLLFVIGFLPILGWAVKALAGLMGLGAVVATRFGTQG